MVTSSRVKLTHKKRKSHNSVAPVCRAGGARLGPNSGPPCCQCHCRSCRACPKKVELGDPEPPRKRIKCVLCERLMFPECLPKHLDEMHSKKIPNRQSQIELHSLKEGEDASFNFDLDQLEGPAGPSAENARSRATKFARTNRFLNAANKVSNMQSIFRRMEDMTSEEETRLIEKAVELMNELAKVKKSLAVEREKLLAKTKRQEQARNSRASRISRAYNPETQL